MNVAFSVARPLHDRLKCRELTGVFAERVHYVDDEQGFDIEFLGDGLGVHVGG